MTQQFGSFLQLLKALKDKKHRYSSVHYTLFEDANYKVTYSYCGTWWDYCVYKCNQTHTRWLKKPYTEYIELIRFVPACSDEPEKYRHNDGTLWDIITAETYINVAVEQIEQNEAYNNRILLERIACIREAISEVA